MWLRTVSSPSASALGISLAWRPIETRRSTASRAASNGLASLAASRQDRPDAPGVATESYSPFAAGCVSGGQQLDRSLFDQKTTTHRPPTGHVKPSRMPYLSASSSDHRSMPTGSSMRMVSVQVNEARLLLARNSSGRKVDRRERHILVPPAVGNILVQEDGFAEAQRAPIARIG